MQRLTCNHISNRVTLSISKESPLANSPVSSHRTCCSKVAPNLVGELITVLLRCRNIRVSAYSPQYISTCVLRADFDIEEPLFVSTRIVFLLDVKLET